MEAIQVGTQALGIKKMDTPGFTGEVRERMNALGGQLTHIDAKLTELIALLTGNAPDRVDKESPVKAPDGELNRIMMHLDGLSSVADQIVSKVDGLSRIL